ncbi:MAG TPA: nucleoside-diphosphate sugar epimerase/dehydratase [Gemmatimonadaceae bacterium]|nr:nucleoside-diphosphate sugar epimerase/dehydratase [Gemmatimonadaceae bacterium]
MLTLRNRHLLAFDALVLITAPAVLYGLRFEGWHWTQAHRETLVVFTLVSPPVVLAILLACGLYRRLWRHASVAELELIFRAGAASGLTSALLGGLLLPLSGLTPGRVPLSVLFANALVTIGAIAAPRLGLRIAGWRSMLRSHFAEATPRPRRRVLIAGAGTAGQMIVREMLTNTRLGLEPVGFVDDDGSKLGHRLSNVPVLGILKDIPRIVRMYRAEVLVIAMPSAAGATIRQVVRAAAGTGVRTQTMPGISELLSGRVNIAALREVEIQDLLRREPIETDLSQVANLCSNRVVLVTGAGGSIGSELCRQISVLNPSRLVLLGHGENSIFDIQNELRERFPAVDVVAAIADVRDRDRIKRIFAYHRPYAVFHAAAHKHVPLMEENVVEAITNNVSGTRNVAEAAGEAGTQHFVLISTDKAVRPTSVMGATKRVAEYVVQAAAQQYQRNYVAVRFGNVLGSRGSVVPMFMRQIRAGGPVTVTHREMRRYFMTIPESVQLVLQAGALGRGGELFMLDMGEPVRIVDLARDLIRLSGLQEDVDIKIQFSGTRPGEKLYEEMFFSHEVAVPTDHPKILRARPGQNDCADFRMIAELVELAEAGGQESELRVLLRCLVPDFEVDRDTIERAAVMESIVAASSETASRPELVETPLLSNERRRKERGLPA